MTARIESQTEPITGYRLMERLGSGGFGEVWKAEAPGGIFKAIKIVHGDIRNRETDSYRFAEQELKALKRVKQVRHPYLLALDRFDIVDGRLMIVMELADCNLWDRFRACRAQKLPGIPRDELLQYMSETAEVLDLMNDQFQLQHLDIKPQNLFLLYNHVKVADFGQVKDLEGMVASVTGGITPVYAAPETFDGFVSRFCDQYSLACVYQELLCGQRPFDGNSMQQLLMQHLQMPPNLTPSPPGDRPALARALAKKPDERFPSVSAMVAAIRAGNAGSDRTVVPAGSGGVPPGSRHGLGDGSKSGPIEVFPAHVPPAADAPPANMTPTQFPLPSVGPDNFPFALVQTPTPRGDTDPPYPRQDAPREITGPGTLQPTLILGLGYTGLRVLQRFRKHLADRFGPADAVPSFRTLYIDTDPDVQTATAPDPAAGLAGLDPEEVFAARLNRAAHYLKPRPNGRNVVDGWFDQQLLYKLTRTPTTMGIRGFGRLALCDHSRALVQKIQTELDACLNPVALTATRDGTGQAVRTNRPRVYVVAGLGGGTGSGMFLDLAYIVRSRLKRMGYTDPDVVGVFHLPPDGAAANTTPLSQANTYAALTELHHYSRPQTVFAASYDERVGNVRDADRPFSNVFLFPGSAYSPPVIPGSTVTATAATVRNSGPLSNTARGPSGTQPMISRTTPSGRSTPGLRTDAWNRPPGPGGKAGDADVTRDPTALSAEFLRLSTTSQVGRLADDQTRPPTPETSAGSVRVCGLTRYSWPRAEVVGRAARILAPVLLNHWVSTDPAHVRQVIPGWVANQWTRLGTAPDKITTRLSDAANQAAGGPIQELVARTTEILLPKGWLARLPDPDRVTAAVDQWQRIFGKQQGVVARPPTAVEEAVAATADDLTALARSEITALFHGLVETPAFRLAGTEEAARQMLAVLNKARVQLDKQAAALETGTATALEQILAYTNFQKGMKKVSATDFAAAVGQYPSGQHQLMLIRGVLRVYRELKELLTEILGDVSAYRQRAEACRRDLALESEFPAPGCGPGELLPARCPTTEDAAQVFIGSLTDDDLIALDTKVQERLERTFGGLYQACVNSIDGPLGLLREVRTAARAYLDARLGEADVAGMFAQHYGTADAAVAELRRAFDRAAPPLVGPGPWAQSAVTVFGSPTGAGGDPVRDLAARMLPDAAATATVPDEVVIYREYSAVPLAAVPQLGPAWAAAYRVVPDAQQINPHARLDVTAWVDVDTD
ncbi:tubulin-like doman-containing protein [Fimbriiglobus ruber]|uniref:Serine/threonine-protein kinase pkn3 n=1 Tax=Fimbriiglobus ruber TaxID=1908690 RepID=A0A225DHD4_9BACT|nr:tubulin-like doman-containing protein [Fimbriiglobus ruber]OWK35795.1 Serine/threonine-protein kinase pkn3 [Fimbriiglobus ruber]